MLMQIYNHQSPEIDICMNIGKGCQETSKSFSCSAHGPSYLYLTKFLSKTALLTSGLPGFGGFVFVSFCSVFVARVLRVWEWFHVC